MDESGTVSDVPKQLYPLQLSELNKLAVWHVWMSHTTEPGWGAVKLSFLNCWREHELENNNPVMVGTKGPVWGIDSLGIGYLVWSLFEISGPAC